MRFLIDECISPTPAERLRQLGHNYEPRLKHLLDTTHHEDLMGVLVLLEEKRHRFIRSHR